MSISPWPAGQTQPLVFTLAVDDGSVPPLQSATLALKIFNVQTSTDLAGAGVFGAINTVTGVVTYTWGTGDPTNTPGTYDLYVIATFPSGIVRYFGPTRWVVSPS